MTMYQLKGVKRYYGKALALAIGSLSFEEGAFYVIYGPNAAGKTTLLNLLAFLDEPSEGEIIFRNRSYSRTAAPVEDVTLVMQNPYLFKNTVLGNVCRGLAFRSMGKKKMIRRAHPVMERLDIWKLRRRGVSGLSGGERRKVALARALVLDTKVLLLDEPTAHVDTVHAGVIEEVISEIAERADRTVLMTTHDIRQAHRLTDAVIYLVDGRITRTPLWNNFRVVLGGANHVKKTKLAGAAVLHIATDRTGPAAVAINPTDILVSRTIIHSSALNCLKGRVTGLNELNGLVDVSVDVGVTLHAFITHKSLGEMGLRVGQEIYVTFKASAVEVF
jgi:molybdopterin-binding protein